MSSDGKALKFFELVPFTLTIDAQTIVDVVTEAEAAPSTESETPDA